ncbi:uncharacterized protein METZ01_LOCUS282477, partial [marine metagenome]
MFSNLLKYFVESKMLAYLFIGGIAASIDLGTFVFLYELVGLTAVISHSVSVPISAIFSFLCNAFFNFRKTDLLLFRSISFLTVVVLGYLLGVAIIIFVGDILQLDGTIGKLVSLPFVFLFQFYLNSKI